MFCRKCGSNIVDGAKFCSKCGTPIEGGQKEVGVREKMNKNTNRKKVVYGIISALILIVAVVLAITFALRGKKAKEYEQYMESAAKYIEELDYEQAKDYYLQAIHVAPKELEPYVRLAKVYVDEGNAEKAEEILEMAEDANAKGDAEIEEEAEQVKEEVEEIKNDIIDEETEDSAIITEDMLYGAWYQDSNNLMKMVLSEDGSVMYYSVAETEDEYTTTWSVEDDILSINLVNLDISGVTTVKYQINYEVNGDTKKMELVQIDDGTDVSKLYGYDEVMAGTYYWFTGFTEEQLDQIKDGLGVPKDKDIQVEWGEPYIWDAADRYVVNVNFYENGEMVACIGLDPWTLEFLNNTYTYVGGDY